MILAELAGIFVAGVLAGTALPSAPREAFIAAVVAGALAAIFRRRSALRPLLLLVAFGLGVARSPHAAPLTPSDLAFYNGRPVTVQGTVAAEPDVRDTGVNEVISADTVTVRGRPVAVHGLLMLHSPPSQALDYGQQVTLTGRLEGLPAAGGYRSYLVSLGIGSRLDFPKLVPGNRASPGLLSLLADLRSYIEAGINAWLPEPEAALLIAVTLGAHSAALGDLAPLLVSTGLIHLIAISGIKVALVAGMLYEFGRLMRREIALALSLSGVWGYVLLTGLTASGTRSAIMWTLVFVAAYLGRGTVAFVSLAVAGAVMVAGEPRLLWDVGFQLSFVGTAAIVVFTPALSHAFRFIPAPFREAWCTTVAAQVGTLPIVLGSFQVLSWAGPVANMVALPFLPFAIALGFCVGLAHSLAWAAAGPAAVAYGLLHALILFVRWIAPFAGSPEKSTPALLTVLYYLAVGGGAVAIVRRLRLPPAEARRQVRDLGVALACGFVFVAPLLPARAAGTPQLIALGCGDAMLLRSAGYTVLVDGSKQPFVLLERLGQVLSYPDRSIDLVVVTDPRAGNVGALRAVLTHYRVKTVLDVGAEYPSVTYASWRADLRERGVTVNALRTGAQVSVGPVFIRALGPDAPLPRPQDSAGMLRISGPSIDVLDAGQASLEEQLESVFRPIQLHARTLILDGKQGMDRNFVRAVGPARVILFQGHARQATRVLPQAPHQIAP